MRASSSRSPRTTDSRADTRPAYTARCEQKVAPRTKCPAPGQASGMDIGIIPITARSHRHRQVAQAAQRPAGQQVDLGSVAEQRGAAELHDAAELGQALLEMVGGGQQRRAPQRYPA